MVAAFSDTDEIYLSIIESFGGKVYFLNILIEFAV